MLVLEFAQNIRKWASGFRFDMAGLPSIGSMVAAGRMQPRWNLVEDNPLSLLMGGSKLLPEIGGIWGGIWRALSAIIPCGLPYNSSPPPLSTTNQSAPPDTTPKCCTRNHTMVPIYQQTTPESSHRRMGSGWATFAAQHPWSILLQKLNKSLVPTHLHAFSFPKFSLVLLKPTFWAKKLLAVACTSPPNGRILPGASSDGEC